MGIDAGFLILLEQGIEPDLAVGDFDSLHPEDQQKLKQLKEVRIHPIRKDETDTQLALSLCADYETILLYGGLGGRLDHTLASLSLMIHHYPQLICLSEKEKAQVLNPGCYSFLPEYRHISFFALEKSQVSLEGFAYELQDAWLLPEEIYTISNSFIPQQEAILRIRNGRLLCIESNHL